MPQLLHRPRSREVEVLEREGATARGIEIIAELNDVYRRTGVLSRTTGLVASELLRLKEERGGPLRVLEIGTRDGVLLESISRWAAGAGVPVELHGVEFRDSLVALAQERLAGIRPAVRVHVATSQALPELPSDHFDVVCSLFSLHHFDDGGVKEILLASNRVAKKVSLHVDLERTSWSAALVWLVYALLGCRQARPDAVLSVRRSHRPSEIRAIARRLRLCADVRPARRPPLYWCLRVAKTQSTRCA